jgi:hypothetical protein
MTGKRIESHGMMKAIGVSESEDLVIKIRSSISAAKELLFKKRTLIIALSISINGQGGYRGKDTD